MTLKPSSPKHKSETYEPEENRTDHEVDEVLEQDVRGVFTTGEARLAEGKARLHEKDQHGCQQHPHGI